MGHDHEQRLPADDPRYSRRVERVAVDAQVALRRAGQNLYRVRVYDASPYGCRLEFVEQPQLEERVWIKFDGLNSVEGMVCWVNGFVAGQKLQVMEASGKKFETVTVTGVGTAAGASTTLAAASKAGPATCVARTPGPNS